MNKINQYILEAIKTHVWGGFASEPAVQEVISDLLEDGADEKMLRQQVRLEFEKKREAEKSWPVETDFDRLERAFDQLKNNGVLCLHNAGYTMSDGHNEAHEALKSYPQERFCGYCFYHGQDLERAVAGQGLMLAYDHVAGDVGDKIKVAQAVKQALEEVGFEIVWDGTAHRRIEIPAFDWKHRTEDAG